MAAPTYELVRKSAKAVHFRMDEVMIVAFGHNGNRFLYTDNLNGCFAVLIISKDAVIGAHIPPRPSMDTRNPNAGEEHVALKMQQVANLYQKYHNYFPNPKDVLVLYAVFEGEIALPSQKGLIEKCLKDMSLNFETRGYVVKAAEYRGVADGTLFVDGGSQPPAIFLEDRKIPMTTGSSIATFHGSSQATSQSTSMTGAPLFPREPHAQGDNFSAQQLAAQYLLTGDQSGGSYGTPLQPASHYLPTGAQSGGFYGTPLQPASRHLPTGGQSGGFYGTPLQPTSQQQSPPQYVKSTVATVQGSQGRTVEIHGHKNFIPDRSWQAVSWNGKNYWFNKDFNIYTDLTAPSLQPASRHLPPLLPKPPHTQQQSPSQYVKSTVATVQGSQGRTVEIHGDKKFIPDRLWQAVSWNGKNYWFNKDFNVYTDQ
jgi:hypothetical protein